MAQETALFAEVQALATEQRNSASMHMDELNTQQILELINAEDAKVAGAVKAEIPHITRVVDEAISRLRSGGRLIYAGAGTSGRMGIVDAAECPPTFGTDPNQILAVIAGGPQAVFRAQEGAEDKPENGAQAMDELHVTERDLVIGIAASKRTPYVLGALELAHAIGAYTVLLTTNPRESVTYPYLSETICPVVGPEVLMGSTRMKSAVAQKMVLTMITTTIMVRMGKVYENMMVDLQQTNKKLEERSKRIVMIATGCDYARASELLEQSAGHVKTAIVMEKGHVDQATAREALASSDGFVKRALQLLASRH
jgi:N-acetylmuramic acid 6-phosphate etherase